MTLALKHPEEAARLAALHAYDTLDTEAESDFDDIVQLASEICDAPISLISLVDRDRQWFKSRKGLDDAETSLEKSVCAHGILNGEMFEVRDLKLDPRTQDNPLVTGDPKLRFYAGAPLMAPGDLPVGMLCVIDHKPRVLTEFQRNALQVLSRQIVTQLELRKRLKAEHALRAEMDHRVKNSLQTLSSMVRMAGSGITDPQAQDALGLISRRIESVGALHRELMLQQGRDQVGVGAYLKRVCTLLQDAAPENVHLDVQVADRGASARLASALGMIVCEFVANALKHAFAKDTGGQISIHLAAEGDMMSLRCSDNGVGSNSRESGGDTGLGQLLIDAAAEQLGGTLIHNASDQGTSLSLTFPVPLG